MTSEINLSNINPTHNPIWFPNGWRKGVENVRAKCVVLHAFGGKLPDHPKKERINYKNYKNNGVKLEIDRPGMNKNFWRAIEGSNGKINAEKLRDKWYEVAEASNKYESIIKDREGKRENREQLNKEMREIIESKFDIDCANHKYAKYVSNKTESGKEITFDIGGSRKNVGLEIYNLTFSEALKVYKFIKNNI